MNNFAITALGRSGTQFLAAVMNTSKVWTVQHEPYTQLPHIAQAQRPLFVEVGRVEARFNQDYYGEVNSYLRHVILDLPVAKKGIILRHPREILLSAYNRQRVPLSLSQCTNVVVGLAALRRALHTDPAIRLIYFRQMTSEPGYLRELVASFGVTDAVITANTCRCKLNATQRVRYASYDMLPLNMRAYYEYQLQDFIAEYFTHGRG